MHTTKSISPRKFIALLTLLAVSGLALFTGHMPSESPSRKTDRTYKNAQAPKGTRTLWQ